MEEQSRMGTRVSPLEFAGVHAGLGNLDEAFRWLDKASQEKCGWLVYSALAVTPNRFAPLCATRN
jgi:hypothetical protein